MNHLLRSHAPISDAGWEMLDDEARERLQLGMDTSAYPRCVASAVERLLCNGIGGPYGVALGREQYRRVVETAEHGGYPLLDHLRKIVDGPLVWAPGVKGAVVVSLR